MYLAEVPLVRVCWNSRSMLATTDFIEYRNSTSADHETGHVIG